MSTTTSGTTTAPAEERNPTVEAWVESFGIDGWDFQIVALSEIDDAKSTNNQARFSPVDQMVVNQYGLAAAAGAKFPPLVLAKVGKALVAIDGNHRRKGLPLGGIHKHPAYIIDAAQEVRTLMTASANTINGHPFTEDEKRHLAVQLHRQGLTVDQVAVMSGLSPAQVGKITRAAEARDRAKDRRAATKVPDGQMEIIGRAASDGVLDFLVANQAAAKPLPERNLRDAVAQSNKQRNDDARLRVAQDAVAAHKGDAAKPTRHKPDASKLTQSLGSILNCNPTAVALGVKNRQEIIDKIDKVVDHLADLQAALR